MHGDKKNKNVTRRYSLNLTNIPSTNVYSSYNSVHQTRSLYWQHALYARSGNSRPTVNDLSN